MTNVLVASNRLADICIYGCTGKYGRLVARRIAELAETPTTLLMVGRNVAKVQELRSELQPFEDVNVNVKILAYPQSVGMEDSEDALDALVCRVRAVVVNCVDVEAHAQANFPVALACGRAGVHYVDLAERDWAIVPLFSIDFGPSLGKIVPACGFDHAFFDLATAQAVLIFKDEFDQNVPSHVQMTLAIRSGPLGLKWPLNVMVSILERNQKRSRNQHETRCRQQGKSTRNSFTNGPFLSYSDLLSCWSIPWPFAGNIISYILHQSGWPDKSMDIRLALPRSLGRAIVYLLYGAVLALLLVPLIALARAYQIGFLKKMILFILPAASLGFFCNDEELVRRASTETSVELSIVLSDDRKNSITYHVGGHCPESLTVNCLVLAAFKLTKKSAKGQGGALTPAQALHDTEFWSELCDLGKLQIQVSMCRSDCRKPHQT